jgi:hypothetical protein
MSSSGDSTKQGSVKNQVRFVLPHVLPRRLSDFTNLIGDKSIVDYLGIISRKNEKISFAMEMFPEQRHSIFKVDFVTQNAPTIKPAFKLPGELCDIINSYSSNFISLKFKIDYHYNYPFVEPVWSLISENNDMTHLPKNFTLTEYYQDIVERHNGQYRDISRGYNWTPAITVRTDTINFIMKILHFDIITDFCE